MITEITAVDPGTTESAILTFHLGERRIRTMGIARNLDVLEDIRRGSHVGLASALDGGRRLLAIEMIQGLGMPVGKETFETVLWIGRFAEAWDGNHNRTENPARLIYRKTVKQQLCESVRATDPNIRAALIDRFGGSDSTKKGGRLYGVKSHLWAALAVAVTVEEQLMEAKAAPVQQEGER